MRFKGTVTVFLTLILIFTLAVIGGLLEDSRLNVAKEVVLDTSYLATQNILAEYQRELWNDYHVFFVDEAFQTGDEEIGKKANQYLEDMVHSEGKSFLGAEARFTNIGMNEAMTENRGYYFMKQAVAYMKEAAPKEIVNKLLGDTKSGEALIRGQETFKKVLQAKIRLEKKLLGLQKINEGIKEKYSDINTRFKELKKLGDLNFDTLDVKDIGSRTRNLKKDIGSKKGEIEELKKDYQKEKAERKTEIEEFKKDLETGRKELLKEDYENLKKSTESAYTEENEEHSLDKNEKKLDEIIGMTDNEKIDKNELKKAIKELDVKEEDKKVKEAKKNLRKYENNLKSAENGVKEAGVLMKLIGTEGIKVSNKKITKTGWKEFDKADEKAEISMLDRVLFLAYMKKHFKNYLSKPKDKGKTEALDYGLEYIAIGDTRDEANLLGVFQRIFGIRTGVWFSYFLSRADKVAEATEIATALVGVLGPGAIAVVKTAILMGWSVDEARKDVNSLAKGKEVVFHPANQSLKVGYEKYLDMFLMLSVKDWGLRAVELVEQNMKVRYNKNFRADNCFSGIVGEVKGEVPPRFFRLGFVRRLIKEELNPWEFQFQISESLSR